MNAFDSSEVAAWRHEVARWGERWELLQLGDDEVYVARDDLRITIRIDGELATCCGREYRGGRTTAAMMSAAHRCALAVWHNGGAPRARMDDASRERQAKKAWRKAAEELEAVTMMHGFCSDLVKDAIGRVD